MPPVGELPEPLWRALCARSPGACNAALLYYYDDIKKSAPASGALDGSAS